MTTHCAAIKGGGFLLDVPDNGRSEDAHHISRSLSDIRRNQPEYVRISQAIDEAVEGSRTDNWDGYSARAFRQDSVWNALRFAGMLPATIPVPDVSVDPDGMVEFEWYLGPRRVFSVTIEGSRQLIYAGLFGPNKSYGTETFGEELPKTVLDNLERLLSKQS